MKTAKRRMLSGKLSRNKLNSSWHIGEHESVSVLEWNSENNSRMNPNQLYYENDGSVSRVKQTGNCSTTTSTVTTRGQISSGTSKRGKNCEIRWKRRFVRSTWTVTWVVTSWSHGTIRSSRFPITAWMRKSKLVRARKYMDDLAARLGYLPGGGGGYS